MYLPDESGLHRVGEGTFAEAGSGWQDGHSRLKGDERGVLLHSRDVRCLRTIPAVLLALVMLSRVALASDVDTQFIFGFTQGADVGELGEKEIESQTIGRFGKLDGSYAAVTSQLRAEYTPLANLRIE